MGLHKEINCLIKCSHWASGREILILALSNFGVNKVLAERADTPLFVGWPLFIIWEKFGDGRRINLLWILTGRLVSLTRGSWPKLAWTLTAKLSGLLWPLKRPPPLLTESRVIRGWLLSYTTSSGLYISLFLRLISSMSSWPGVGWGAGWYWGRWFSMLGLLPTIGLNPLWWCGDCFNVNCFGWGLSSRDGALILIIWCGPAFLLTCCKGSRKFIFS